MFRSIKNILSLALSIIGISLFLVIILGFRQFQLTRQYNEVTALSEGALFAFSTIREQVTESLISRDYRQIERIIPQLEQLNTTMRRLYDSDLIPAQSKLAMAGSIDLAGLVISLGKIGGMSEAGDTGLELQRDMRLIAENLLKTDRIIAAQIRSSVVGFQLTMIGVMGGLLSAAGLILILLYRRGVKPLLELARQVEDEVLPETGFSCPAEAGSELEFLVASVNERLADANLAADGSGNDLELLSTVVNETANGLNGMINYAQLLLESSAGGEIPAEHRDMLERIIENGERIAGQWQGVNRRFSG